jgi:hypothetical protein
MIVFPKIVPLWYDVYKYGRDRVATDSNTMQRVRIACWINKA